MPREAAEQRGLKPLARLVSYAHAGVDPRYMGIGPVPATRIALERAGLATDDPRKRAEIYRTIGRRVHDTVPFIPLFRRRRVSVFNDDLRGYDPAPVAAPWWNAYAWSI